MSYNAILNDVFFPIFGRNEPNRQKDRIKISTFTKFGYVSLRGNQAVKGRPNSIQKSNSKTAPEIYTKSLIFAIFENLLHGFNLTTEPQTW